MEGSGFVFGLIALIFAMMALEKVKRLEKRLKEAGVLKNGTNRAEE